MDTILFIILQMEFAYSSIHDRKSLKVDYFSWSAVCAAIKIVSYLSGLYRK